MINVPGYGLRGFDLRLLFALELVCGYILIQASAGSFVFSDCFEGKYISGSVKFLLFYFFLFRDPVQLHGALINGLETRVSGIESQLSDLDARGSEEHDNLANERELHRFILTGELGILCFRPIF